MVHLEVSDATFTYPQEKAPSLKSVSFQVPEGSFTLLCGPSGCGKTTLLRMMKPEIRPHGDWSGTVRYFGEELSDENSLEIGMIFQDPDHQIVMEEVQNELCFGMENLGLSPAVMRKRLAEIVQFFDLESLLHRKTDQLSGGEKQLLNLASVLLMKPKVILLDEPTAQLDPIASKHLLQMLERLNQEWGLTIVLVEHRLDELFPIVDQVLFLESGHVCYCGEPNGVIEWLWSAPEEMHTFIPMIPKMALALGQQLSTLPLSVKQGRAWWLQQIEYASQIKNTTITKDMKRPLLVELREIYFRYQFEGNNVLEHLMLGIEQGEALAILGRNGSGKSTLLQILAQHITPQRGKVVWYQKMKTALLPQNPKALFMHDRLESEIESLSSIHSLDNEDIEEIIKELHIEHLLHHHPHDFSGGELQRAALALLLCTKPQLLLLDEPTKGLDPISKRKLLRFLQRLQSGGTTIILVTHDLEFAIQVATRCALLFQGEITEIGEPRGFFADSFFYTTILQRVLRDTPWSHISSWEEFYKLCPATSTPS